MTGGAAVAAGISLRARTGPATDGTTWSATKDWHIDPGAHFSDHPDFVESWPAHCVVGTGGADFHPELDTERIEAVFHKGEHAAAYSGFEGHTASGESLAEWLRERGVTEVEVVGIATDHCVRATALDAVAEGFATTVLLELTAGVARDDDGRRARGVPGRLSCDDRHTGGELRLIRSVNVVPRRETVRRRLGPVMTLTPYRETLALRGIKSLLVVATLARIPITAGTVTLTLHVVLELGLGYFAAGLVGAAFTVGGSLGAPVMGRLTDRKGLRPVLVLTTVAEVLFWFTSPLMPYWALLVAALVGGFLCAARVRRCPAVHRSAGARVTSPARVRPRLDHHRAVVHGRSRARRADLHHGRRAHLHVRGRRRHPGLRHRALPAEPADPQQGRGAAGIRRSGFRAAAGSSRG